MTHRNPDDRPAAKRDEPDAIDAASVLGDLPQFELDFALDDECEPTEVTVFAPDLGDGVTAWISADVHATVDLADVA